MDLARKAYHQCEPKLTYVPNWMQFTESGVGRGPLFSKLKASLQSSAYNCHSSHAAPVCFEDFFSTLTILGSGL